MQEGRIIQQRRCESTKRCPVTIGAALLLASCAASPDGFSVGEEEPGGGASRAPSTAGAGDPGGSAPTSSFTLDAGASMAGTNAAAAPAPIPPITPTTTIRVLRIRDITAGKLIAGIVYAHRLDAKSGVVRKSGDALPDAVLAEEAGRENLKVAELVVDVLYAHDIHAESVEIGQGHVSSVKIDKPTE